MATRRDLLVNGGLIGAALLATPHVARADKRVRRIGSMVGPALDELTVRARIQGLRKRLADLGWIEGQTVTWDIRSFGVDAALRTAIVEEFVAAAPDLIITTSSVETALLAARTKTIPILFATAADPVGSGFVRSLTRPDSNVTGFSGSHPEIGSKWLELLTEIAPSVRRVGVPFNPTTAPAGGKAHLAVMEREASQHRLEIIPLHLSEPADIEPALARLAGAPDAGLALLPDSFTYWLNREIATLAATFKLPAIYPYEGFVQSGGLMSYAGARDEQDALIVSYANLILRGADIAELPVQFSRRFELVISASAAANLGLAISASLRARATRIAA